MDYFSEPIKGRFYESEVKPVADKDMFLAEKVVRRKKVQGKEMALVKWLGYEQPTWVDASILGALSK